MPTTVEALLILSLVLTPGFLFTLVVTRTIAHLQTSELRFVLTIVAMGVLVHGILMPWTIRIIRYQNNGDLLAHWMEAYVWGIATIFALPLGLGLLLGRISRNRTVDNFLKRFGFSYIERLPSAWDFVVLEQRGFFVRVYLAGGQGIIGGVYGQQSFASTDPRQGDLYIQELWQLDDAGSFVQPVPDSRGIWIHRDSMHMVEFLSRMELSDNEPDNSLDSASADETTRAGAET